MKSLVSLLLFTTLSSNAAITPYFSIKKEQVCNLYEAAYKLELSEGISLSFKTEEIVSHSDDTIYQPDGSDTIPVKFSKPFNSDGLTWLEWVPVPNLEHSFKWGGSATNITAVGDIKPSADKSFVLKVNTIGWRGPFYSVWLVEDETLSTILAGKPSESAQVSFAETDTKLIFPESENSFSPYLTNVFQFNDEFYTVTNSKILKVTSGVPEVVCQIGTGSTFTSPQLNRLEEVANSVLMTKGITHISMYYGSMGNPHNFVKDAFSVAIQKPWLIQVGKDGKCLNTQKVNNCEKNRRVEAVLSEFAASDPWSYREIAALRHHIKAAHVVLSGFYKSEFNIDDEIANGLAIQAVYDFLEKTVALHPYIRQGAPRAVPVSNPYTLDRPSGRLAVNWFYKTELMWASHFNDFDAVKRLLSKRKELNNVTSTDHDYTSLQFVNRSALTYAVENGSIPLIQKIISAGADINIKDSKDNTLSMYLDKNHTVDMTWEQLKKLPKVEIKPSFDCKLARTKQEKAICNSQGLSVYDQQLGLLYKKVRETELYPEIKSLQRGWLRMLRTECSGYGVGLTNCMKDKYRSRIKYFANLL